jgi:hypothetical protein
MNERIFLMAIHNHQPVGNFEHVFDRAFRDCYSPLLQELNRHPGFKFTLHFSGPLWDYMKLKERTCWELVGDMASRGQVELMGGGFYEPILSVIPEEDRIAQVELMRRYLARNFGVKARGLWLAERVWEPNLPRSLARAGVEYTLLDQEHFYYAGVRDIHASYVTEDEGQTIRVFPIDKTLRYLIPFRPVGEVRSYLAGVHDAGGLAILGDDGEKFGLWPGTHDLVFGGGWLGDFLDFIEHEGIQTLTMAEAMDRYPARESAYIPPASYEEMMGWVLKPEEQLALKKIKAEHPQPSSRYLRGGFFREFFKKYPESNLLHKRMLLASHNARLHPGKEARKHVFKAQGNDPYWHGVFGGLYLPHLREAAYHHIIEAEKLLPLARGWSEFDLDADGRREAVHRGQAHSLFVKPSYGGALVNLDSPRLSRNLLDVISRKREAYHLLPQEGGPEGTSIHELGRVLPPNSEGLLVPDQNLRYSLLDRFYASETTPEDFAAGRARDLGDFCMADYKFEFTDLKPSPKGKGRAGGLLLTRRGSVNLERGVRPLILKKRITPRTDGFVVAYELENASDSELSFVFGSEWNFCAFPGEWEIERDTLWLYGRTVRLSCPGAEGIWSYPVRTLSQSEKGYDIIHQGVCFMPAWRRTLSGRAFASMELTFREQNGT